MTNQITSYFLAPYFVSRVLISLLCLGPLNLRGGLYIYIATKYYLKVFIYYSCEGTIPSGFRSGGRREDRPYTVFRNGMWKASCDINKRKVRLKLLPAWYTQICLQLKCLIMNCGVHTSQGSMT